MTPKKECIVFLSLGNSIFIIDSTFLGSHYHSTWDQRPKNKTSEYLNCRFSSFSRSPFFPVVSRNRISFCYATVQFCHRQSCCPQFLMNPGSPMNMESSFFNHCAHRKPFPLRFFIIQGNTDIVSALCM